MFGLLLKLLSSCISFQYPVYASYKALKSRDQDALVPWLVYWVVVSIVTTLETWFGFLFVWLPLYQFARFGFMLWLVMPQSQGANYVYYTYVEPTIASHEQEIEALISTAQVKAKTSGLELLNTSVEYIKCIIATMVIRDKNADLKSTDSGGLHGFQFQSNQALAAIHVLCPAHRVSGICGMVSGGQNLESTELPTHAVRWEFGMELGVTCAVWANSGLGLLGWSAVIRAVGLTTDDNGTTASTIPGASIYYKIWSIGNAVFNAAYQTSVDVVASPTGAGVLGGAAAGVPSADMIATMFGNAAAVFVESAATAAATTSGGAIDMKEGQLSTGEASQKSQGEVGEYTSYYSRSISFVSRLWARKSSVSPTVSTKSTDDVSGSSAMDAKETVSRPPTPQPAKSWPGQFVTAPQEGTGTDTTTLTKAGESIPDSDATTTPEGKNVEWVII
ncbi:TB2/DP1, HVA22 family-domain-containing protein [Lipomyces tetrasporus]|uniref:TB2/DP1, HVA22 family-domain-containing protein n=1 Tax=Lipomyces tetrasporus TaxID=54092 RepID=A0AAD7QM05_9ASCO|nr:TB2/DP1, HVA22 family-domain-containing protein [Lipomyces tetrasporus]KAJ8097356.1 TB2/DP1, HVA22 family-domain-containing protein [Lipomyces tetrasporus]